MSSSAAPRASSSDLLERDALGLAELVRKGEVSPRELADAAIARIESGDAGLGAVVHQRFERAREEASSPDLPRGPFHGVPFLMKDLGGDTAGDPYYAGLRFLRDAKWISPSDSYLAAKLRAAGFVFLGRTNTPELGLLPTSEPDIFPPTRNPWDRTRSAGGSSGGSAAAVAAGFVSAAHASDGGGSIRIPASHCGLVGLKVTRGRNSFGPGMGERWGGFSVEGAVTHTVRDTAAILDVTNGPMPGDPYAAAPPARPYLHEVGADPGRLRIGVLAHGPRNLEIHPECAAAAANAAKLVESLGHDVEESHPDVLDDPAAPGAYVTIVASCVARALDAWGEKLGKPVTQNDVETLTWAIAEAARGWTTGRYLQAIETVHALGRRSAAWWERGYDLLLTPTVGEPPPPLGSFACPPDVPLKGFLRAAPFGLFTSVFNQTGQPALSLPLHQTADGLPVGVQLVAATGREDLLLRVAAQIEEAAPWRARRPPPLDAH